MLVGAALFVTGFAEIVTAFGGLGHALGRYRVLLVPAFGALTIAFGLAFVGALGRIPGARVGSGTLRLR